MEYHIIAFGLGFLIDMLVGDPYFLPHPIRLIGGWIAFLEKKLRGKVGNDTNKEIDERADSAERNVKKELRQGRVLVCLVLLMVLLVTTVIYVVAYNLHPYVGVLVEAIMTYQILATKCLKVESMKVYDCLRKQDMEGARKAVSMIVGRDTACLDEVGITKAAIETVAENTSDGAIAPMIYTAIGGPILGFVYKAINTMDSMVGYKNEKYLYFGRAAAKLDDVVNYLPARISAYVMIVASYLGSVMLREKKIVHDKSGIDEKGNVYSKKILSGKEAWRIYKRDNRNHASPNSAQTEAVCAGALGIQLAGDASYFGKIVQKPYIGDANCPVEVEDIKRANQLLYITAWLCVGICVVALSGLYLLCNG